MAIDFLQVNAIIYGLTSFAIASLVFYLFTKTKSQSYVWLGAGFMLLAAFEFIHEFITAEAIIYLPIRISRPLGLLLIAVGFWRRGK